MEYILCCSITKVKRCLCVLKQVLVVNLYNINIQDTIIKGGFQTWSYIKCFFPHQILLK